MRKDSAIAGIVLAGLSALVWFRAQGNGAEPLPVNPTAGLEAWQVVKVSDGDTITVQRGGQEERIRFCGIDAPESKQPMGSEATAALEELVQRSGGEVMIDEVERDRYDRVVAEVGSDEVGLLNSELVGRGMAFVYDRYVGGCPNRDAIVVSGDRAEELKLGVWAVSRLQKPWDYRKSKR